MIAVQPEQNRSDTDLSRRLRGRLGSLRHLSPLEKAKATPAQSLWELRPWAGSRQARVDCHWTCSLGGRSVASDDGGDGASRGAEEQDPKFLSEAGFQIQIPAKLASEPATSRARPAESGEMIDAARVGSVPSKVGRSLQQSWVSSTTLLSCVCRNLSSRSRHRPRLFPV